MEPSTFAKLLDDLIKPENRAYLILFGIVLAFALLILGTAIYKRITKQEFNYAFRIKPLWFHFYSGSDDPSIEREGLRKLLYVSVIHLSKREDAATPSYIRHVDRLDDDEREVKVYDEAVYYTLKQFKERKVQKPEIDDSTGVVDARLAIPWTKAVSFSNEAAQSTKGSVRMESKEASDTVLTVSHFLNGLQGRHQNFCTCADEDAASLRLIVDFSSVPNAAERVNFKEYKLLLNGIAVAPKESDDLRFESAGDNVYMAHCKNAKKGWLLQLDFTFTDWD